MRRCTALLLCILLIGTAGCGSSKSAEPPKTVNFTCDFTATYRELEFAGSLERASAGMLKVSLTVPNALNGMTLTWDGETKRVSLGMLHFAVDSALPPSGFGQLLLDTLDAAFCNPGESTLAAAGAQVSGRVGQYEYQLTCEPETGTLLSLQIPDADLSIHFSNLRAI